MPAMDDARRLRSEAWAGLVEEVAPRTPSVAEVLREHPSLARRTRDARASAKMARQSLARVAVAVEAAPKDAVQLQLVRAWAGCLDDILALTERLCGIVAAA
jgi:hypothetical protein